MSTRSRRRSSRASSRFARWALVGLAGLTAVGCTRVPSNTPEGYADTIEDDPVPIVEQNFMALCAGVDNSGESAGASQDVCECMYGLIVDEVPFDRFEEYDQQLKDDPEDLPDQYKEFADRCEGGEASGSGSESGGEGSGSETTTTEGGG